MRAVRFSVFEIDVDAGELRRQGRLVPIAAQPLKALALLAARAGDIVTRDELRRHLWGDHTFVDFDRSLNFCIASIRAALGDSARNPRFIETLPKRGYRFLADVRVVKADGVWRVEPGIAAEPSAWWTIVRRAVWAAIVPLLVAQAPRVPRAHSRDTAAPAARAAFARGLAESARGADGLRRSVHAFREAARLDGRFAEAQYALADVYMNLADRRELPAAPALAEARDAARRAIALEDMPESRVILGTARLAADWDWTGAGRDFAAALRLAPDWDFGFVARARYLSAIGDDRGALAAIDRAETISPSCELVLWESALVRDRARRFDEAADKLTRALELGPPDQVSAGQWQMKIAFRLALVHAAANEWTAARQDALAIMALAQVPAAERARVAASDAAPTMKAFFTTSARLHASDAHGRLQPTLVAELYAAGGNAGPALEWLGRAARDHDPDLVYSMRSPAFDAVRETDAFRALEGRVHPRPARVF